jgi:hypothetical protein
MVRRLYSCTAVRKTQTSLTGNIVCTPQHAGPVAADQHCMDMATLPEFFSVVYVGEKDVLANLQRQIQTRAKYKLPEDRQLPLGRRED